MLDCLFYRRCAVTVPLGYHIVPPLNELDSMAKGSTCPVRNFTVCRDGYGEIHFPGITDVYGLNLGQIGESFILHGCTRKHD